MLQNIIQKYKHFIAIACVLISFLFLHNHVYCHPLLLTLITPAIGYFSSLSPEFYAGKIIDKVFEYSPWIISKSFEYSPYIVYGTGILGITAIGLPVGVKLSEFVYNWRYFANQYAHNTPVVGSLLKGANTTYKWFTKKDLTNIEYNYFYPKIAKALGYPDLFNKKLEIDLSTFNSNLTSREPHVENRVHTVFVDTPINVTEFKEKSVYVPNTVYKDRENLVNLEAKVDNLSRIGNDLIFIASNQKSRELLIAEINSLREHENAVCLYTKDLNKNYASFRIPGVTNTESYSPVPIKLKSIYIPPRENLNVHITFDPYRIHVELTQEVFKQKYPSIYLAINTFARRGDGTRKVAIIDLAYIENRNLFNSNFVLDPTNCILREDAGYDDISQVQSCNLLTKMEESQILISQVTNNEFNLALQDLKEKISNENRLINVETKDQGIQTAYFDLNETIYDRINSFLEIRDETAFIVASHEGRNLPFNNMHVRSYSKPQEIAETQTTSMETQTNNQEMPTQIEPMTNTITNVSASQLVSNLLQNSAMLFGGLIVAAASDNFQSIEVAAKLLAGFTNIPEYNQAFLAATQMSIADLQMEYGFGPDEAKRAYETLGQAYDIRQHTSLPSDISYSLSDSTNHATNSGFGWKNYLLIGTTVIAAGCILYIGWQKIKTGSYIDGNEIHAVSPNIEAWKKALFDKINKQ